MSVLLDIKTERNANRWWMIWRSGMYSSEAGMNEEKNVGGAISRVFPGDGNVDNQATKQRWRASG